MYYLSYWVLKETQGTDMGFFQFFYDRFSNSGDSVWYVKIAKEGYASSGEHANLIVFYPLYPFLMKIVTFITRNYFVSGVLISNVCFGVAVYFMYRLALLEMNQGEAKDSVLALLLYPFGVFLGGVFTESLFIMLMILGLYFIRKRNWLAAGIVGLLAALSRSQGIVLLVPAVYELCMETVRQYQTITDTQEKKKLLKRTLPQGLALLLIPFGTILYLLLNYFVQGDCFAFVAHQAAEPWYNVSHWISDNLAQHYNMALEYGSLGYIIYWVQIALYFIGVVAIFYGLYRKMRPSYMACAGAYIFLSYLHGWLISGPRYMLSCIPLYLVYGKVRNPYVKTAILCILSMLFFFYTLLFMQGQAIM